MCDTCVFFGLCTRKEREREKRDGEKVEWRVDADFKSSSDCVVGLNHGQLSLPVGIDITVWAARQGERRRRRRSRSASAHSSFKDNKIKVFAALPPVPNTSFACWPDMEKRPCSHLDMRASSTMIRRPEEKEKKRKTTVTKVTLLPTFSIAAAVVVVVIILCQLVVLLPEVKSKSGQQQGDGGGGREKNNTKLTLERAAEKLIGLDSKSVKIWIRQLRCRIKKKRLFLNPLLAGRVVVIIIIILMGV